MLSRVVVVEEIVFEVEVVCGEGLLRMRMPAGHALARCGMRSEQLLNSQKARSFATFPSPTCYKLRDACMSSYGGGVAKLQVDWRGSMLIMMALVEASVSALPSYRMHRDPCCL